MAFYQIRFNFTNKILSAVQVCDIMALRFMGKRHTLTGAIYAATLACPLYVSSSENPLADYLAWARADSLQ